MEDNKNFKHIVRIANTDIEGSKVVVQALRKVKGISFMFAHMVCTVAKVDEQKKIASKVPILYGGSVTAENAAEFVGRGMVDGLLVGGASLNAKSFVKIVEEVGAT